MARKTYSEFTPEQKEAYKERSIASRAKTQKQIPLSYKKEIATIIYDHAADMGTTPIRWIKSAISEKYKKETGKDLEWDTAIRFLNLFFIVTLL